MKNNCVPFEKRRKLGKPIFDSLAVTGWKALRMVGIDPRLDGWGCLLAGAELALTSAR